MKLMSSVCNELYKYIRPNFEKIIKQDDDLFKHPVVTKWHEYFMNRWISYKKIALILPCTAVKPYSLSPTHKVAYSIIKKRGLESYVQIYSLSEPMLLVPKELEECYPFNSYDYPPRIMTQQEKEEFVYLLIKPLKKISKMHEQIIAILPRHHYNILKKASELSDVNIKLYSYGKLAFKTISDVISSIFKPL